MLLFSVLYLYTCAIPAIDCVSLRYQGLHVHVQLEASALLLDSEGNARGASSTRGQAAEKYSLQQSASPKIEVLEKQQDALQQQFQALSAAFQRSEQRLDLQQLEDEQWTVAEGLLQVSYFLAQHRSSTCHLRLLQSTHRPQLHYRLILLIILFLLYCSIALRLIMPSQVLIDPVSLLSQKRQALFQQQRRVYDIVQEVDRSFQKRITAQCKVGRLTQLMAQQEPEVLRSSAAAQSIHSQVSSSLHSLSHCLVIYLVQKPSELPLKLQVDRLLATGQTAAAAEQAAAAQKADVRTADEQQKLHELTESLQEPSHTVTEAVVEHAGVSKELDICISLVRIPPRSPPPPMITDHLIVAL